jgi:periplasmic mercuric ion binding protein
MNPFFHAALTASALLLAGSAGAGEKTVKLAVENVTCITCAPIVKRTLSRLPGVSRVDVAEQAGATTATVSFDEERVTPEALTAAVTNAGFPAHVLEN